MEWKKSSLSGAELERKRKEYIEAAMKMSDRAQTAPEPPREDPPALPPFPDRPPDGDARKKETEEIVFTEPETPPDESPAQKEETETPEEPETPQEPKPPAPELLHEPEPIGGTETQFGVFDVGELIEAVQKGELDGEKLREASDILAEMSGKTEEMQRIAERPDRAEGTGEPVGLGQSVRRHNGGSCPRCGQGNRNGTRR